MPNTYFQFKQFTVHQEKTAMKICTDSCLFGAWVADHVCRKNKPPKRILDIGTGTGLLSLMMAQKCAANIDTVEIDEPSAQQAKSNFEQSLWRERLHLFHSSIQDFSTQNRYDFIISNPPFYNNYLLSDNKIKNIAHHNTGLTLHELIKAIKRLLADEGSFAILLPHHRTREWELLANEAGYFLQEQVLLKQSVNHSCFRSMNVFSTQKQTFLQNEIAIKDANNNYSQQFISLLKDYYLHL